MNGCITETDLALLLYMLLLELWRWHTESGSGTLSITTWLLHTLLPRLINMTVTRLHLHPGLILASCIRPKPKLAFLEHQNLHLEEKEKDRVCRNVVTDAVFTCPCLSKCSAIDESRMRSLNVSSTRKSTEMELSHPFGNGNCVWRTAWFFCLFFFFLLLSNQNSEL